MADKVSIRGFLDYFTPRAKVGGGKTSNPPPAYQDGYSMGAVGQVATEANLKQMAINYQGENWQNYYNRTKKWLGRRVWDCNGLAEGYYKDRTGISINTKARLNYANWCGKKSPTAKDTSLTGLPQVAGVAVFSGKTASSISHVGFLLRKNGPGPLDWDVLESKGADYGVCITNLKDGNWGWWGIMDKYFDYDDPVPLTGWQKGEDGRWRFYNAEGKLLYSRWFKDGNFWYYLMADGTMAVGWAKVGSKWYYLKPDSPNQGSMMEGWLKLDGKTYYLTPGDGDMVTGTAVIDGKNYTFNGSGELVAGE